MKIYISGQITGLDYETAKLRFLLTERFLIAKGHEPFNPMADEKPGLIWAEYMAADIIILDGCNAIYMLRNWRASKGARIEHSIAEILGKEIIYEGSGIC